MLRHVDHIGIVVKSIEKSLTIYRDLLGLKELSTEIVPDGTVKVTFLEIGTTKLELIEPINNPSIVRFLEKRGEGLHHICFLSSDIAEELRTLREKGVTLIDTEPRKGAHGMMVAFVHPRSLGGVLVELAQPESEYRALTIR